MQLLVPSANAPLAVAQNTKAIVAAQVYGSQIKITHSDQQTYPVLQINDQSRLIEPNAIVRYLSNSTSAKQVDEELIKFEETVLYESLQKGAKLDEATCGKLSSQLKNGDVTASHIIVFGALHGLVTFVGKTAISKSLEIVLWHQKFSGNARVQPAVKVAAQYNGEELSAAPSSRTVSSTKPPAPAAKAQPKAQQTTTKSTAEPKPEAPKPERTGAVKVKSGVEAKKLTAPVLPKEGERNVLITSALPYVNNVPHLGNIVGCVLGADMFARYCKARNYNTLYICGTDEYGTATETKAIEENMTPRDLCTKYYKQHKEIYDWFQIDFDNFGRTSTEKQTEIVQDVIVQLHQNGYLEEHTTEQWYCAKHQGFLADRFVEGVCPYTDCQYDDARGDQCDKCGRLINALDLVNPRCKLDNESPEKRETKHVYLSLDKLQPAVEEWNNKAQEKGKWTKNARSITSNWLKEGLRPRSITRNLKWGVEFPDVLGDDYKDMRVYAWIDAVYGYASITAAYTDDWEKWWKNPDNVTLYQFMGKDNVPFHSVILPSSEVGTGYNWTMLHHLNATEYLQYEGGKFSKSRNLGVFGNNAKDAGIPASVWRYYLTMARPESADTQFSWSDFVSRNNSELLANLGNFVNRIMKFANKSYNGVVAPFTPTALDTFEQFEKDVNKLVGEYITSMEGAHLRHGIDLAMQISARGNQFLQENKLDNNLFANYPEKCAALVGVGLNLIYLLSAVLTPFIPETSKQICEQLNAPERSIPDQFDLAIEGGHNINKAQYLFSRIPEEKVDQWRAQFGGKQE